MNHVRIFSLMLCFASHIALTQTHSLLKNIGPGNESGVVTSTPVIVWSGKHYFIGEGQIGGHRLFTTDGTSAGTVAVHSDNSFFQIEYLTAIDDGLIFNGWDDHHTLYISDGTQAGTNILRQFPGHRIELLVPFNAKKAVILTQNFAEDTTSLWITDGTSGGTEKLGDVELKPGFITHSFFKDQLIFSEISTQDYFHAVITDGTPNGTMLVKDYVNAIISNDVAEVKTAAGTPNFLFIKPEGGNLGYVFDGTAISQLLISGDARYAFNIGARQILFSNWGITVYDSVAKNFVLLAVEPNAFNSPILHEGKVYFQGSDGFVYETNGTDAGTKKVSSQTIGSSNFSPYLYGHEDHVYYSRNGTMNHELWQLDLTTGLDSLFAFVRPLFGLTFKPVMAGIGDRVIYLRNTTAEGIEFWVYNPIMTGTDPVQEKMAVTFWPNPVHEKIMVRLDSSHDPSMRVRIMDLCGKPAGEFRITNEQTEIDLGALPTGMYVLQILSGQEVMVSEKFVRL